MAEQQPAAVPRGRHAPPLEVRLGVQRHRLLTSASTVVSRDGYAAATAEAISREAGMSKATFYEHFRNKEECVMALFDESATELAFELGRAADAGPFASYEERVHSNVRAFLETLAANPDWARTLLVEVAGASPRVAARRDAVLEAFADGLLRDNARHAPEFGAPVFASHDDAFAVVGGIVELVARRLRAGGTEALAGLEPVIVRLVLGTLHRAATG